MINAYSDLIAHEADDWEDYLTKICLIGIFKELLTLFKSNQSALKQAIRYIVFTYSKNSDCIVMGDDWLKNKERIFNKSGLPSEYYEDMVLLQNRIVVNTIQKWVAFQDNNTYSNLTALKDLMIEMRLSANSAIKKSDGITVDFDQKFKNAEYVFELEKMIRDLEQELIQNSPLLKSAAQELSKSAKAKNTLGLEAFVN